MKTKDDFLKDFYWQDGYGAFSVYPSEVDVISAYHCKKTFQDKYKSFLKKYMVVYYEQYVWD